MSASSESLAQAQARRAGSGLAAVAPHSPAPFCSRAPPQPKPSQLRLRTLTSRNNSGATHAWPRELQGLKPCSYTTSHTLRHSATPGGARRPTAGIAGVWS
eukprot:7671-Chlamydomonas_euryale.AAC.1